MLLLLQRPLILIHSICPIQELLDLLLYSPMSVTNVYFKD